MSIIVYQRTALSEILQRFGDYIKLAVGHRDELFHWEARL
jgi:hypothetical protein